MHALGNTLRWQDRADGSLVEIDKDQGPVHGGASALDQYTIEASQYPGQTPPTFILAKALKQIPAKEISLQAAQLLAETVEDQPMPVDQIQDPFWSAFRGDVHVTTW